MELDKKDKKILNILQDKGRIPYHELADKLEMSQSAVYERVKKLQESGVIKKITPLLDKKEIGDYRTALVRIKTKTGNIEEIAKKLTKIENIQEVYSTSGRYDILIKIVAKDMESLNEFITKKLSKFEIRETTYFVIMKTYKEDPKIKL